MDPHVPRRRCGGFKVNSLTGMRGWGDLGNGGGGPGGPGTPLTSPAHEVGANEG